MVLVVVVEVLKSFLSQTGGNQKCMFFSSIWGMKRNERYICIFFPEVQALINIRVKLLHIMA